MPNLRCTLLLLLAAAALSTGCDNVGRAFDPDVTPPTPGNPSGPSPVQVPPARGDLRDGRPAVRATYPKGGGWPSTVPIVVEFSESMNESSIVPTTTAGLDGKVVLRLEGTTQVLPALYDFLAGGRLLVIRPVTELQSPTGAAFEVVQLPGLRDADGVQFAGTAEQILATFTLDTAAPNPDGAILAVYPRDNARDVSIDSDLVVVFTKAPNALPFASASNFLVRTSTGTAVAGTPEAPLTPADTRIVRFRPAATGGYAVATAHELVVTAGITFGTDGELRFSGRTPFSRFTTAAVPQPVSITVANPAAGFADKVNRGNLATLQMGVEVPAATVAGDRVLMRVYGLDRQTQTAGDLAFVERIVTVATDGAQTVTGDFGARLGSVANTRFEEGALSFVAQLQRGAVHSGMIRGSADAQQDTVAPTLVSLAGAVGSNGTDLYTELEDAIVFGTASEQLGDLLWTAGGQPVRLFASRSTGTFVSQPLHLGRSVNATAYSLAILDRAGNESAAPTTGVLIQRGLITGDGTSGDVVVEAFDDATLRPLAGATVHVDPGAPTVPASAQRQTLTTDASGRATFTGLPAGTHTISVLLTGYDPISLYDTGVGFASLPLRPTAAAAALASLTGAATLDGSLTGATVIVGSNLIDDATVLAVRTSTVAPTVIPPTAIVGSRPQVLTAFGGVFEATANPSFAFHACNLLGGDVATPSPPPAPVAAGAVSTVALVLRDRGGDSDNLALMSGANAIDYNLALSLNTNNLTPRVRFMTALDGWRGQVATGVGFATGSISFAVTGSYSTAILDGLAAFNPRTWMTIEVEDSIGSFCRTRARVDTTTSGATEIVQPQWIPLLDPPSGPSTGPPLVSVFEALATADVTSVSTLAVLDIVARDPAGRQWRILAEDTDGRIAATTDAFQFPDPGSETGLAVGAWSVRASARLFRRDSQTAGNFLLADRLRQELSLARSAATTFTVQ